MSGDVELYRPATGTDGMIFEAEFCDRCARDVDLGCKIHTAAFVYDTDEPGYPREWRYVDGKPVCTEFQEEK